MVCSKQLFKEALGHTFDQPKRWQLHNINEIMNTVVTGWKPFSNPRMFAGYGRQKGWECDNFDNELSDNEGWICGTERGRMPPAGTSEGVDCLRMMVCCQLVAGFVAGKSMVLI